MEQTLLELETKLFLKSFCSNIHNLEQIFDLNFYEYGKSGTIISREETIQFLLKSEDRMIQVTHFSVASLTEDTWVVHYLSTDENNVSALRTSIWILKDHRYQLYFHQGTKTIKT